MGLVVGFVYDIEAVFVAEFIPIRVVRIVAGSYCIDIQLFHYLEVAAHICLGNAVCSVRVHLVAVHSLYQNRLAVHIEELAVDFHRSESCFQCGVLAGFLPVGNIDIDLIEVGSFGGP